MPAAVENRPPDLMSRLDRPLRDALCDAGQRRRFSHGQVIHKEGDSSRALSIVETGKVSIGRIDVNGRATMATILGPGSSFGEIPLLTGRLRTHDAVAIGDVELIHVSLAAFRGLLDSHHDLRDHLLANLAETLAQALEALDDLQRLTVPHRLARFLLGQLDTAPDQQCLAISQGDIADALSVTREAVVIALRHFRTSGLVETSYRRITVPSVAALRRYADASEPD